MAKIVGGFIVPHDPLMFVAPAAAPMAQRQNVEKAFAEVKQRIAKLAPTAAVVVGADHYIALGPRCLPQYLIATGELAGPVERLPGIAHGPICAHKGLARHITACGSKEGFDWAVAKVLTVDHSVAAPVRLCLGDDIPVVAVLVAAGVEPLIPSGRSHALGEHIRRAVDSFESDDRVVIIGSGGVSHWVGLPQMGRVNVEFDRMVLGCVISGDAQTLIDLPDDYVLEQGGNGGLEIRTFLVAMGALPGSRGELIAYEPVREWITGLGFCALHAEGST